MGAGGLGFRGLDVTKKLFKHPLLVALYPFLFPYSPFPTAKQFVIIAEIGLITKHQLDFDLFDEFAVMHRLIKKLLILVIPEIL